MKGSRLLYKENTGLSTGVLLTFPLPQRSYGLHQINGKEAEIQHRHRPGIAGNGVNHTNQRAAHIKNAQLQHRVHHHRDDHQCCADITENFKVNIHTVLQR